MPSLTLEGDTLGEKHKHFNKLVHDAVTNKQINLSKINYNDSDIDNLLKIHTACRTKNVDYIIEVLKCEDMLYVSTAIKQSTWLITEQEHAHIVNPEYLYTQLFPHMLTKAVNKLLLHIRLHLKDETRVEAFYTYFKDTFSYDEAEKWLLNCSIPFIDKVIQNEPNISMQIYKRLCKRSVKFLPYYKKVTERNTWRSLKEVLFLVKSDTEDYLDVLDKTEMYCLPPLGKKHTEIIMKKCPNRILDNFQQYVGTADSSVVAKYIKKEDLKSFVLKHAKNNDTKQFFDNFNNMKHFIKNMPKEDRFEFVKMAYIEKTSTTNMSDDFCDAACLPSCCINTYEWYQYAPFNEAVVELKKLILGESSPAVRCGMLSVMIKCARKNLQHAKTVLQYYYDKHRNEPFKFKIQFVNNFITNISTHELDSETWGILDKLFHSLEVYIESNNNVQLCLQSIIVFKVLHDEKVPDIVETKLTIDTFEKFQRKLNDKQSDKLSDYLLNLMLTKINNKTIANETEFYDTLKLLNNALNLVKIWKRDIKEYTFIHDKIRDVIKLKKQYSWETNLSSIYDVSKSWRRHLFEESIMLCPSERVCLNALKHEPQLLDRYSEEVNALRTNDAVTLQQLLTKLRVYWPQSIAAQWTDAYLKDIDTNTGHKALFKGLFVLLPQNQLRDLAKKHVPEDFKIDWSEINQTELSLSKNIAKSLYRARPLTPLDVVLWYAKGDYLQFAVPSLNAILHNISRVQSSAYIPKLLEAPVSLQKFGLHLAFIKLEYQELKSIFSDIWQSTNNLTIRTHLFIYTYNLLCKVKEESLAKDLWEVLNMFISNLTEYENKIIYNKMGSVETVHVSVRGEFLMKSYAFLDSLPPRVNCESQKDSLIEYASNIMDLLDADFVADKILAPVEQKISKPSSQFIDIMSAYVLHGKTDEEQCERFRRVMVPALEHALNSWDLVKDNQYVMKNNVDALFQSLTWAFRKFVTAKKVIIPTKLFSEIRIFMEQKMPITENYIRYTTWKLITEYVALVAEHEDMLNDMTFNNLYLSDIRYKQLPYDAEHFWETLHIKLSPKLGPIIVKHLKKDTEKYFPTICWLFSEALDNVFLYLSYNRCIMKLETLKYMVLGEDYIPSYIVVCNEMPKYYDIEDMKKPLEIRKILSAHPSQEVQMHYQRAFGDTPVDDS